MLGKGCCWNLLRKYVLLGSNEDTGMLKKTEIELGSNEEKGRSPPAQKGRG